MHRESVISDALNVARDAARAAVDAALPYFQSGVATKRKSDGSLVTKADQAAEEAILRVIRDTFPDHSVLTEETGVHEGVAGARWIIDPLDGTHRFARGLRFWGPLIALELDGEIVAGAAALAALNETYTAARGHGAFRNGQPIRVSPPRDWAQSNLTFGSLARLLAIPAGTPALEMVRQADYTMAGSDLEGGLLVARGEAELWVESGVQPWDVAPFKVIIEEAGGRFTDLAGGFDLHAPAFVGSNGHCHDEALALLNAD